MIDVVIASLPLIETQEPMMAPALLKGVVKKTGLSCYTIDFNAEINNLILTKKIELQDKITRWFLYEEYTNDPEVQHAITEFIAYTSKRIMEKNPTWLCLSLFCNTAKKFNVQLCQYLKKNYKIKIIIGGNAVFTDTNSKRPYGLILQKAKIIDYYIVGDGEEALFELLTTGQSEQVNKDEFQILDDLSKQPYSDYDDYNWKLYETKRLPMYASRGCVRRCTFCDVYKLWKKFKLRYAEDVFAEMLYQIKQTGISNFYFRDSLINGSISEYRKLITLLAEYNQTATQKIRWTSFFIFRPAHQMSEEDWQLTAASGAQDLVVGVESLVDSIRFHMRKKFTNADIDHALEMAAKYKVGITMLLIIGYVNETEQDFNAALTWLEEHKQYAGFPIHRINVGGTLTLTDLSDLYQNAEEFDITIGNKIYLWENKSINLDYATREHRKQIFIDRAIELNYPIGGHEKPVA